MKSVKKTVLDALWILKGDTNLFIIYIGFSSVKKKMNDLSFVWVITKNISIYQFQMK